MKFVYGEPGANREMLELTAPIEIMTGRIDDPEGGVIVIVIKPQPPQPLIQIKLTPEEAKSFSAIIAAVSEKLNQVLN